LQIFCCYVILASLHNLKNKTHTHTHTHTHFWQNVCLEVSPSLMFDKMLKHFHVLIWWNIQMNFVETFPKSFERLVLVKRIPQKIFIWYLYFRDALTQRRFALWNFKGVSSFQNCSLLIHFPNFPHFFNLFPKKHIKMPTPIQTLLYKTFKVKLISPPKWVVKLVSPWLSLFHKTLFMHFGIYVLFQLHWTISH